MKKFWMAVFVLSACVQGASAYAAESFSADMVTQSAGQTFQGKMYFAPGKMRFEMAGTVMITRLDKQVAWMLMPDQGMYMEQPVDPKAAVSGTKEVPGETERVPEGKENVNGRDTDKFKVSYTTNGRTETIYQWIAPDLSLPVRVAAADATWQVDYLNIRPGAQPDALFEVPGGFQKMSIPSMAGLMSSNPPQE
jgi:hypothetical protein